MVLAGCLNLFEKMPRIEEKILALLHHFVKIGEVKA